MTRENRRRLTALVTARTKLEAASQLAEEAAGAVESSGLLAHEHAREVVVNIDALIRRITSAIGLIP